MRPACVGGCAGGLIVAAVVMAIVAAPLFQPTTPLTDTVDRSYKGAISDRPLDLSLVSKLDLGPDGTVYMLRVHARPFPFVCVIYSKSGTMQCDLDSPPGKILP